MSVEGVETRGVVKVDLGWFCGDLIDWRDWVFSSTVAEEIFDVKRIRWL